MGLNNKDWGIWPDHQQHDGLAVVEVTDQCNVTCPVSYADSSPQRTMHLSLRCASVAEHELAHLGHQGHQTCPRHVSGLEFVLDDLG